VVLYAQDGYRTTLSLEDILKNDVLLADSLDGQPLSIEHGAPLRLVAPEHYGYKNLKHLKRIEFYATMPEVKRGILAFLDHPRARVAKEERGRWIPGWILRYIYRLLIPRGVKQFREAMLKRNDGNWSK
jgi:DMSO/TMAO reductase YedYZ molybdopterin-dependent catalytic subunit